MGEGEFIRDVPPRRVCVKCRRVYAGRRYWHDQKFSNSNPPDRPCSECGGRMVSIPHSRKMPKRRNVKAWKRFEDYYRRMGWIT